MTVTASRGWRGWGVSRDFPVSDRLTSRVNKGSPIGLKTKTKMCDSLNDRSVSLNDHGKEGCKRGQKPTKEMSRFRMGIGGSFVNKSRTCLYLPRHATKTDSRVRHGINLTKSPIPSGRTLDFIVQPSVNVFSPIVHAVYQSPDL